jgi:hypothetical protein
MSVRLLSRSRGCVLCCNECDETLHTVQIQKGLVRAYAKTIGWGRGLLKKKRRDLCDACMPAERQAFAEQKAEREKRRLERDEKARAKRAAEVAA